MRQRPLLAQTAFWVRLAKVCGGGGPETWGTRDVPDRWETQTQKGGSPKGWGPEGWEPQNFALFFTLPLQVSFFLPSSSRGFVAWVRGRGPPKLRIWASLWSFCGSPGGLHAAGGTQCLSGTTHSRHHSHHHHQECPSWSGMHRDPFQTCSETQLATLSVSSTFVKGCVAGTLE